MRGFILGTLLGAILGILGTLYTFTEPTIRPPGATVTTTSGEPLSIRSIIRERTRTIIDTKYDGAGESRITIPEYRYSASCLISTDRSVYLGGGYALTPRISLLGGVWFRSSGTYAGGVYVGGQYRF